MALILSLVVIEYSKCDRREHCAGGAALERGVRLKPNLHHARLLPRFHSGGEERGVRLKPNLHHARLLPRFQSGREERGVRLKPNLHHARLLPRFHSGREERGVRLKPNLHHARLLPRFHLVDERIRRRIVRRTDLQSLATSVTILNRNAR